MTRTFVVCFLCLLLFVAAVDTIPDPPALNPPQSHSGGISALHIHGSSTSQEEDRIVVARVVGHLRIRWITSRLDLEFERTGSTPLDLVRHAADTSPPVSA